MLLTQLLVDESSLSNSQTVALLALMCFNEARLESRLDEDGHLVPLDQQDRSRWNSALIRRGYTYLNRSSQMESVAATRYHLEAAIASRHCAAISFDATDLVSICHLYDRLLEVAPSPIVELNRAVAVSYRDGPFSAIPIVEAIRKAGRLPNSYSSAAVLAHLYARAGQHKTARRFLDEALSGARTQHERQLIAHQIEGAHVEEAGPPAAARIDSDGTRLTPH
jgi:RNA polymerase sigma-70 factor (ECF subfamily)